MLGIRVKFVFRLGYHCTRWAIFLSVRILMNLNKVLFFGELAPGVIHGISLSNKLNIDLMSKHSEVYTVEERTDLAEHGKRNTSKVVRAFRQIKQIYSLNRLKRCDYFYTVFSLSTFGSLKTLGSLIVFRISGKGRIVLHIHRGDFEHFYDKNILNKCITKLIFRFTRRLVVLSEQQKSQLADYIDYKKIYVLENSLNTEYDFVNELDGKDNFIFISNYIAEKGIYELLDVFKKNRDINLKCFGSFVNNKDAIEKYNCENIEINSFLTGDDKFQEIHKSDALILPSWNEGQPTIILEAMMVGTIVLTTKIGLIEEMLGADYPFYFDARNTDSLEKCINKFRDYTEKEEVSLKLKNIYLKNYSKDTHEKKLMRIFA